MTTAVALRTEFFMDAQSVEAKLDGLLGEYAADRKRVEQIAEFFSDARTTYPLSRYLAGNRQRHDRTLPGAEGFFELKVGVAALDADYWQRVLDLTDVLDFMPSARRQEWGEGIRTMSTPAFTPENVVFTIGDLLNNRLMFLSEMVDGIYHGLSGQHVTNRPEGFTTRMIVDRVMTYYDTVESDKAGLIHDMRSIIARLTGRDQPKRDASHDFVRYARDRHGDWVTCDGGALRLRVYLKGTGHIEIHEDLAWRLNEILAYKYPKTLFDHARRPSPKRRSTVRLLNKLVPFEVLQYFRRLGIAPQGDGRFRLSFAHTFSDADKHVRAAVLDLLVGLGGEPSNLQSFVFDYDPTATLEEIYHTGAVPDDKSHQFYPTPANLAERMASLADIGETDIVLEPSAGLGHIADKMPDKRNVICVEVGQSRASVLRAKGYETVCGDFLSTPFAAAFDRVIMNPPFSEGRAAEHTKCAWGHVKAGGRLVALLPSSVARTVTSTLPDVKDSTVEEVAGFPGVSIDVSLLVLNKDLK